MGNWLWGAPKPKADARVTANDNAVLALKRQRDNMKIYTKKAEAALAAEVAAAKELLQKGDKKKAILALKKKKAQEKQIEKAQQMMANLEEMVQKIETAAEEVEIFKALEQGKNTLQKLNDQIKIEDVERLMEDTEEALAYQQELDNILSGQLGPIDEAALEAELAEIEEQQAMAEVDGLKVPSHELADTERDERKTSKVVESKTNGKVVVTV